MKLSLRCARVSLVVSTALLMMLAGGCAGRAAPEDIDTSEDPLRTTYADLLETLDGADLDRWIAVRRSLREGLARTCSGAPCSDAYSSVTHVRLACSSTRVARKMKDCVWVLGESVDHVDALTGDITGDVHVWTCHVPVSGRAGAMLTALETAGDDALRAPLPGTGASFGDALTACLADRSAAVAATLPTTQGAFAELGDERRRAGDGPGAAWADAGRRLNARFDEVCGDSFCEGDYPDVAGLGLSCAVDCASDRVATCSWSFASADTAVDTRGHLSAGTKTTRCTIPIDAGAASLDAVLASDDPLEAPLPGRDTSLYDALADCL